MNEQMNVDLNLIDPNPYQLRLQEDPTAVREIADSILKMGLMQAPTARKVGERYQLAFGHTRLAAFKLIQSDSTFDSGASRVMLDAYSMPLIVRELTDLEMFELAVAENIKRRDLNPIELARAMKTYMDPPFGKTSEEAGAFFGVSAETVRGTVRLLKLPEPVQDQVKTGAMKIGAARKFLTVQNIDPKAVKSAQTYILKLEEASSEAVDRELNQALGRSKTAVEMWRDFDQGEPRGGPDLWPLAWKHNGRLAPLTAPEMLEALGIKKESNGTLWDRMQDLKRELEAGMAPDPALYPEFKAEAIERVMHLIYPPTCLTCPLYTKLENMHYCGLQACWARKAEAWTRLELTRLSEKLAIPIYDESKDGKKYTLFEDSYDSLSYAVRAAINNKKAPARAGLRLMACTKERAYGEFPGTEHHRIAVIDVAGGIHKDKSSRGMSTDRNSILRQRRQRNIKHSQEFVKSMAAPAFASVVAGVKCIPVLQALAEDLDPKELKGMAETAKRKFLQARVAEGILTTAGYHVLPWASPWSDNVWSQGPVAIAKQLQRVARSWDIKLPKDWMEQAKAMMPKTEQPAAKKAKGKRKVA